MSLMAATPAIAQYSIKSLGQLPTDNIMPTVTGINYNGSVIVGYVTSQRSFRWTPSTGIKELNLGFTNQDTWDVRGVSGRGLTLVGYVLANGIGRGFVYSDSGGTKVLSALATGTAQDPISDAYCANYDGSVIGGYSISPDSKALAVKWTNQVLSPALGPMNGYETAVAARVSGDGLTFMGYGAYQNNYPIFRWNQWSTGLVRLPFHLVAGYTPGGLSYDGQVVVGSENGTAGTQAARWTPSGVVSLGSIGTPPTPSVGCDTTADGSIAVGTSDPNGYAKAFIWTAKTGMLSLKQFLLDRGVTQIQNWTLYSADFISQDGSTIVGYAIDDKFKTFRYVVTMPSTVLFARENSYITAANQTITSPARGVLLDDINATGATAVLTSQPAHGTLTFHTDGSFVYVPSTDYCGPDTFWYRFLKNGAYSNYARVSIFIHPLLSGLAFAKPQVVGGNTIGLTITVSPKGAQHGGNSITVTSDNPALASVYPAQVVTPGQTSTQPLVSTHGVAVNTNVGFHASYYGTTLNTTLTVLPATLHAMDVPLTAKGGTQITLGVRLTGAAPSAGSSVTLTSSRPDLVPVTSPKAISPQAWGVTFLSNTTSVSADTLVTITATYGGLSKSGTIKLTK